MTEEDARTCVVSRFGESRAHALGCFADLVVAENQRQNLIAPSTVAQIWSRHLLDSAQLIDLSPAAGLWVDVGTGGGFPGFVVAMLRPQPTLLIEPRRRRAEFLTDCAREFGLTNVEVRAVKVEKVSALAATLSARAVASVENLLHAAAGCATTATRWLLPRGKLAAADVERLKESWAGMFHVEQSLTDAHSSILVLDQVRRR